MQEKVLYVLIFHWIYNIDKALLKAPAKVGSLSCPPPSKKRQAHRETASLYVLIQEFDIRNWYLA